MQQLLENEGDYMKIQTIARQKWGDDWLDHFEEAKKIFEERKSKENKGIERILVRNTNTPSRQQRRQREREEMKMAEAAARILRKQSLANDPYIPKKKKKR